MGSWIDLFRSLGQALVEVYRAEVGELSADLATSGKRFGLGLALLAAAGAVGFWTLGVLTYGVVQVVALWLPLWGAALAVAGVFAFVVAALALVGLGRIRRAQTPAAIFRRRFDDHVDWLESRFLGAEKTVPATPASDGDPSEEP